jgi:hypothetical protein
MEGREAKGRWSCSRRVMVRMLQVSQKRLSHMVIIPVWMFDHRSNQLVLLATENDFDVVLIDTAGRMQDNEVSRTIGGLLSVSDSEISQPLMRALAKVSKNSSITYRLVVKTSMKLAGGSEQP